jgi:hypothetical protein
MGLSIILVPHFSKFVTVLICISYILLQKFKDRFRGTHDIIEKSAIEEHTESQPTYVFNKQGIAGTDIMHQKPQLDSQVVLKV